MNQSNGYADLLHREIKYSKYFQIIVNLLSVNVLIALKQNNENWDYFHILNQPNQIRDDQHQFVNPQYHAHKKWRIYTPCMYDTAYPLFAVKQAPKSKVFLWKTHLGLLQPSIWCLLLNELSHEEEHFNQETADVILLNNFSALTTNTCFKKL